jgi:hypothetical protein
MKAGDLSLEELKNDYVIYYTVGDLLDFIKKHKLSRNSKILVERVEDVYYNKYGWKTVKKEGNAYWDRKSLINKAKSGVFNDKSTYPNMTEEHINNIIKSEEILDETKNEYHPVWCPVKYKDDDNLYLDLHY